MSAGCAPDYEAAPASVISTPADPESHRGVVLARDQHVGPVGPQHEVTLTLADVERLP